MFILFISGRSRVYITPDDATHDHSKGEPDKQYLTVLRALQVMINMA
jgi:hypothetical protein